MADTAFLHNAIHVYMHYIHYYPFTLASSEMDKQCKQNTLGWQL